MHWFWRGAIAIISAHIVQLVPIELVVLPFYLVAHLARELGIVDWVGPLILVGIYLLICFIGFLVYWLLDRYLAPLTWSEGAEGPEERRRTEKVADPKPATPTIWCLNCRYPLDGLMENRCPECGCRFDPDDAATYWDGTRKRVRKRYLSARQLVIAKRCVGAVSFWLLVQPLVLYWRPLAERNIRAELWRSPNLRVTEKPWTPTPYHRLYAWWSSYRGLPVPRTVFWIAARSPLSHNVTTTGGRDNTGDPSSGNLTVVSGDELSRFGELENLTRLFLSNSSIEDEELRHIGSLKHLKWLDLRGTNITDEGLKHLRGLNTLERLYLSRTKITDKGMAIVQELPNLRMLDVQLTRITDEGMAHIQEMKNLEQLFVAHTKVTAAGIEGFRKSRSSVMRAK
jgi:hypothetical protein